MEEQKSTTERPAPGVIASRLVSEFDYSPASAELTARDLTNCSQPAWDAFVRWWQTGDLGQLEVEGFSVAKLVRDHALRVPGAFLMLDWLLREPSVAKAALARGFDSVGHGPGRERGEHGEA